MGVTALVFVALLAPSGAPQTGDNIAWRPAQPPLARLGEARAIELASWRPPRKPACPPPLCLPAPEPPGAEPKTEPPPTAPPPASDAFASAGQGGTMAPTSFEPGMFGDLVGFSATRVIDASFVIFAPSPALSGGIKIADYESPRPTDRIFYNFNNFTYVNAALNPFTTIQLSRHVVGFEKALLSGNASVGLRLPFVNVYGSRLLAESQVANMSVILKYAPIAEPSGNVLSGGVVFTVPTGPPILLGSPTTFTTTAVSATYFQPYLAFIRYLRPRLFLHGFSALLAPSDSRLVTLLTSDAGLVLLLQRRYREGIIQGLMPTVEVHTNIPLDHRGSQSPVGFFDNVNLTAGCSFLLQRAVLGWAIGTPLTGPRPFSVETIATLNFRF